MDDGSRTTTGVRILHSKLRAPAPRAQLVERPRLTSAFDPADARALTLVDAPAGWGKSTLLGAWIERMDAGVAAFLQLDRTDNEPAVFWTYVLAALRAATRGAVDDLDVRLELTGASERLALQLADALWDAVQPVVLVLDDLHLVPSEAFLGGLGVLIERAPPGFHLVVGTRSDPALPVARLRASGKLTELRMADLAFTRPETAVLLNDVLGLGLSESDVGLLHDRTEGWPAGTYLAGLSMREKADRSAFIAAFSGDARHIVDYLAGEVLAGLDDDSHRFLIETSVLETLTPQACDAVLERADSAQRPHGEEREDDRVRDRGRRAARPAARVGFRGPPDRTRRADHRPTRRRTGPRPAPWAVVPPTGPRHRRRVAVDPGRRRTRRIHRDRRRREREMTAGTHDWTVWIWTAVRPQVSVVAS